MMDQPTEALVTHQPTSPEEARQAERLAALHSRTVTGPALFDTCLELVSAMLAHRDGRANQAPDDALEAIFFDIQHAASIEVATTYGNLMISMLEALEIAMGIPAQDLWRQRVAVAAERNEGGRHG